MVTFLASTFCLSCVSHDLTLRQPKEMVLATPLQSQLFLSRAVLFVSLFIEGTWSFHLSSCAASLHGWKGGGKGESECVKWVRDCKSLPSVYAAAASKGMRTASPQTYWFISTRATSSALPRPAPFDFPPALRRVVQVEPTASPPEGKRKPTWQQEWLPVSSLSLPVNL